MLKLMNKKFFFPEIRNLLAHFLSLRRVKMPLAAAILIFILLQLAPFIINSKPYVEKLAEISEKSGAVSVFVKGDSMIRLWPAPALVISNVEIKSLAADEADSLMLTIDNAELEFSIWSVFSSEFSSAHLKHVKINGAFLQAETKPGQRVNYDLLILPLLKKLSSVNPEYKVAVDFSSGSASLLDDKRREVIKISDFNALLEYGEEAHLSGVAISNNRKFRFTASRKGSLGATPIKLHLESDGYASLNLLGEMDMTSDYPVISGKIDFSTPDLMQIIASQQEDAQQSSEAEQGRDDISEKVSLVLNADYKHQKGLAELSAATLELAGMQGNGSVIRLADDNPNHSAEYNLTMNFKALELEKISNIMKAARVGEKKSNAESVASGSQYKPQTLFAPDLNVSFVIAADSIMHNEQSWQQASLSGTIGSGVMTVNKLHFSIPGESKLDLFGVLSLSDAQSLRFQGKIEGQGASLREALTVFDESASQLPEIGFGAYDLKADLFISRELLRLSEADANFSDLSLKGGFVAYLDKKPRFEADIGLKNINFDLLRDRWRSFAAQKVADGSVLSLTRDMNFDWLKKLAAIIDFRVTVQGFNFLERKGNNASFRLFAQQGELGVYNARFVYDEDTTEGSIKFDVNSERPRINLVLNTAIFDTRYLAIDPSDQKWSDSFGKQFVKSSGKNDKNAQRADKSSGSSESSEQSDDSLSEQLPEMTLPEATPEEEMRKKIEEEASAIISPQDDYSSETVNPVTVNPVNLIHRSDSEILDDNAIDKDSEKTNNDYDSSENSPENSTENSLEGSPENSPESSLENSYSIRQIIFATLKSLIISEAFAQENNLSDNSQNNSQNNSENNLQNSLQNNSQNNLQNNLQNDSGVNLPIAAASEAENEQSPRWINKPIDMNFMDALDGDYDISVGSLQHSDLLFENFKMSARLERNLLTFKTLTFFHWGGSFSINGTVYGGKVPGISIGMVVAGADIAQITGALLEKDNLGGRVSISGTIDTAGIDSFSWLKQANAKFLIAARGMSWRGFDVASVPSAVAVSKTPEDVLNNVNLSLVSGNGEYSADGAINISKAIATTPGIALKTGKIVGTVTGDLRLLPWDVKISSLFRFPDMSDDTVPVLTAHWAGDVVNPVLQTDTQELEALVSRRITGN